VLFLLFLFAWSLNLSSPFFDCFPPLLSLSALTSLTARVRANRNGVGRGALEDRAQREAKVKLAQQKHATIGANIIKT
jgi:hypothetical protein